MAPVRHLIIGSYDNKGRGVTSAPLFFAPYQAQRNPLQINGLLVAAAIVAAVAAIIWRRQLAAMSGGYK